MADLYKVYPTDGWPIHVNQVLAAKNREKLELEINALKKEICNLKK